MGIVRCCSIVFPVCLPRPVTVDYYMLTLVRGRKPWAWLSQSLLRMGQLRSGQMDRALCQDCHSVPVCDYLICGFWRTSFASSQPQPVLTFCSSLVLPVTSTDQCAWSRDIERPILQIQRGFSISQRVFLTVRVIIRDSGPFWTTGSVVPTQRYPVPR